MTNLFIASGNDSFPVNCRRLYSVLNPKTPYTMWFERMREYGFVEGKDFLTDHKKVIREDGAEMPQSTVAHSITISMAKELCALQRNKKGKETRLYLISVEERYNDPEIIMARAVKIADAKISSLKELLQESYTKIEMLEPKGIFYDTVTASETALPFDAAAKIMGFEGVGRNNLFAILRERNILRYNNDPYQEYIDKGYFVVGETPFEKKNGDTSICRKTYITQKGLSYIVKLLMACGYRKIASDDEKSIIKTEE